MEKIYKSNKQRSTKAFPPLRRGPNAPSNPGPAAGCWMLVFKSFLSCIILSCLPSRRIAIACLPSFFKFSCRLAFLPDYGSANFYSLQLLLSPKPCMHVRFSRCVGNLIVIPYYSNYLYSTILHSC